MQYQFCRWYDPYPRLSFAFKLLHLAPRALRQQVITELKNFLSQGVSDVSTLKLSSNYPGNRWYDASENGTLTFELLKKSPDSMKQLSANKILTLLFHTNT